MRSCQLEHGSDRRGPHTARVRAVHLHDPKAEGVDGGAAARVPAATPPHFPTGCASVEAEPMRAHLDGRFAALAETVAELAREARKRERQTQRQRRFGSAYR